MFNSEYSITYKKYFNTSLFSSVKGWTENNYKHCSTMLDILKELIILVLKKRKSADEKNQILFKYELTFFNTLKKFYLWFACVYSLILKLS